MGILSTGLIRALLGHTASHWGGFVVQGTLTADY